MKNGTKIFTAILLALNVMPVCASDPIDVKGILTDSNGEPLEYAHIMVINNKQLEKETLSGSDGTFYLQKVPADAYLEISYQGLNLKRPVQKGTMHIQLSSKHDVENVNIQDHNCPLNAEWSDIENHCVCKDKDQEIIGGICMDKPKSSLQGPPLETQQLPNEIVLKYECEKKGSGSYWDKKENACICKDKNQQLINGVCVDKPQRTSSLDAPQELPEETQTIPQYECEQLKTGTKWENGKCICINLEQELTDDGCVDKKTKKEKCNIPNALTTRRDGDVCKVVSCKPGYQKGNNNTACFKKDKTGKECGVRHGTGKFDENGKCILEKCNDNNSYKLNTKKNTCEKINQRELNKQECDLDTSKEWKRGKCVNKCDDSAKWNNDTKECECGQSEKLKNGKCVEIDDDTDDAENSTDTNGYDNSQTSENEPDPERLEKLRQAYDDARETEQSHENRLLTAGATVATGLGAMELAKGLSEQNADKTAEQSMASYIATMRCKYGNGKQVKVGQEEIELPGGNDAQMMQLRAEYIALANDLKTRKEALGMRPGIESEEILDKSQIGLYDDENIGITDGAYSSLYRAQIYETQKDQEQIDKDAKTSKNRVIGGAVAGGVGAVGGALGDSLLNGELHELIQSRKDK